MTNLFERLFQRSILINKLTAGSDIECALLSFGYQKRNEFYFKITGELLYRFEPTNSGYELSSWFISELGTPYCWSSRELEFNTNMSISDMMADINQAESDVCKGEKSISFLHKAKELNTEQL
jgi:hypothetical protein